jgi:hypothetical protein
MNVWRRAANKIQRYQADRKDERILERLAREISAVPLDDTIKPVVFFNASSRLEGLSQNAAYSLLSAWGLRQSGAPIVHFVCRAGMSRCVLGTSRTDPAQAPPCKKCIAQSERLFTGAKARWFSFQKDYELTKKIEKLDLKELSKFTYRQLPLGQLVLPSLRWILRQHHLSDDHSNRTLMRKYIASAWNIVRQFVKVIDDVKPDTAVIFNGQFFPEATARYVAKRKGLRVITHEVAIQPFSCFFTEGEATAYPIDIPPAFQLTKKMNARLDAYLQQRFQGNFTMAGIRFWPHMKSLGEDFWQRATAFKQIVPIFTNVVFDTSQGHANVVFPHMFAWLDLMLKAIKHHPETFFVIRAHPDEGRAGKESQESVAQWVRANNLGAMPNVLFVDANEYFSSYELIQRSKFVTVYNSTIGLEASILGSAVLCAGKARYTQLPTVYFPKSAREYEQKVEKFLEAPDVRPPSSFQKQARRFYYYQLFRTCLPYGDLIEEDKQWRGFVHLKRITAGDLLPERSPSVAVFNNGILRKQSFILRE